MQNYLSIMYNAFGGCLGDNRLSLDSIMQNSGGIWVVLGPHLIVSSKIGVGVSVSMVIAR